MHQIVIRNKICVINSISNDKLKKIDFDLKSKFLSLTLEKKRYIYFISNHNSAVLLILNALKMSLIPDFSAKALT